MMPCQLKEYESQTQCTGLMTTFFEMFGLILSENKTRTAKQLHSKDFLQLKFNVYITLPSVGMQMNVSKKSTLQRKKMEIKTKIRFFLENFKQNLLRLYVQIYNFRISSAIRILLLVQCSLFDSSTENDSFLVLFVPFINIQIY